MLISPAQKMLRQWNYRDYYHPNITAGEAEHLQSHIGMPALFLLSILFLLHMAIL